MVASGLAMAAAIFACSPAGLLNSVSRISGDGARLAVDGAAYGAQSRQRLDVWVPREKTAARLPVVVFFYGGGWVAGKRGDYGFAGRAYAARDFIAVVPDYRLVPEVRFPSFVEDGALAVKWARDNAARYGGDPDRISLAGHSAGAYIGAMLSLDAKYLRDAGVDPRTIRAAALMSGPYDFYPFTEPLGRNALGRWPRPLETQPIHFARRDAPPMMLIHGQADTLAHARNSVALAARLRAAGSVVDLRIYPGKSHIDTIKSLSPAFRGATPALADSVSFLKANSR